MISAGELRARFDAPDALGIGIEEELFLLDGETLDLLPRAREVIERVEGDPRFKLELPASQLEIVTPPCARRGDRGGVVARRARATSRAAAEPIGRLMTAGTHPTAAELGVLTDDPRYQRTLDEYGERARRQLVSGLHLHVSLGRRRPVPGGLQRVPLLPAGARRAGRQRAVPRRARHRAGLDPPDDRGLSAASGRPAGDPVVGVVRLGAAVGRGRPTRSRTRAAGGSSCACTRPTGRSSCGRPTRSPRSTTCAAWRRSPTS